LPVALRRPAAISGRNPPNQPFPMWYGMDNEVYRIRAGKNSTRNAAIGP